MKVHLAIALVLALAGGALGAAVAAPAPPAAPPRAAPAPATKPAAGKPPAQPAPRLVTSVEGISEYALGNGLRVLLFPDPTKDTFTINVTYLVGSRMEGYGETGMAHLLEHMLFKGSPRHPRVWEELQQRGAANNASTWYDRTNYFETLPSKGDNLAWAIELEADRMVNANIAQSDLDKEFSVVRNEFERNENRPDNVLSQRIWSTAYLWHNYGKSTIGSRSDIERVPATSLKRFYKKYYRPDNAVLVVAGKFDAPAALNLVASHFGPIANPPAPIEPTYTTEPVQDGERTATLRRNGDVQVVGLAYHVSAAVEADFPAVTAISDILTSEPSGRLYVALVKSGLATSVDASALPLHDPGLIELSATLPANKSLDAVRDKMIAVVESFAKSKISDEELARFKAKSRRRFKLAITNSTELGIRLSESIAAGDWRLWFVNRDRIAQLTTADVQKAAAAYLVSSNRTLGLFTPSKSPERAPERQTPDIARVVAGYQGAPPEAEGEKFEATIDNIEKRTTRSVLASGGKLAILAKQTRGHTVRAQLTLRFGSEADFTGHRPATVLLDALIQRGTKRHTFQQLKDQWDAMEAQVGFVSRPGLLTVSVQTTRDQLAAVLALVDEVLREPVFPQDQFEIVVKETITALEDQRSDPESQAYLALRRAISPYPVNHPLYAPTTEEAIAGMKALRVTELKQLAAMLGTSNATLAIVGDVDTAAIRPWIERTWGSWKSPRPWKRLVRKYTATTAGERMLDFPDKANAMIATAQAIAMRDDDPDAPAMVVADYVLGGGGFASRMMTRLRQKDGLSYGAYSGLQLDPLDPVGSLFTAAILNPENGKKGLAAMLDELTRMVESGLTGDELAAAKQGLQQKFDRDLSNDGFVLQLLAEGLYLERKLDFWARRYAAIAALTADQVNAAIKRHVRPDALVTITSGDKKKM